MVRKIFDRKVVVDVSIVVGVFLVFYIFFWIVNSCCYFIKDILIMVVKIINVIYFVSFMVNLIIYFICKQVF